MARVKIKFLNGFTASMQEVFDYAAELGDGDANGPTSATSTSITFRGEDTTLVMKGHDIETSGRFASGTITSWEITNNAGNVPIARISGFRLDVETLDRAA